MKEPDTTVPASPVSGEAIPPPRCAWVYDDEDTEASHRCITGKPALYYNCNESGPVCEDHRCRCKPSLLTERAVLARDKRIGALHERRHQLQRRERLGLPMTAGQEKELSDVLTEIDVLEMAEYEENTGPYRREQDRRLVELMNRLRSLLPADAMAQVDAEFARLLNGPAPDGACPEKKGR